MSDRVLGSCGSCGGLVTVPAIWHGTQPPRPQCSSCHAVAAIPSLPVIPVNARDEGIVEDWLRPARPQATRKLVAGRVT